MSEDSFVINSPLLLEYYEAKIQMLSVFSWKPALEMSWYIKIQIFLFLKALLEVKLLELWWKI